MLSVILQVNLMEFSYTYPGYTVHGLEGILMSNHTSILFWKPVIHPMTSVHIYGKSQLLSAGFIQAYIFTAGKDLICLLGILTEKLMEFKRLTIKAYFSLVSSAACIRLGKRG